jgi:hypothetical protein
VSLPDPTRLAALDMYGTRGSPRRRRIIRAEFFAGAAGCTVLGILVLVHGSGGWLLLGVWLVGAGTNYVPLALAAQRLSPPGALDAELSGLDVRRELRKAGTAQLWIAVRRLPGSSDERAEEAVRGRRLTISTGEARSSRRIAGRTAKSRASARFDAAAGGPSQLASDFYEEP